MLEMHVRAEEPDAEQTHHGKVPMKDSHRGGFCDQLPVELPPEHSVFHTIPLKDKECSTTCTQSIQAQQT